MSDNKTKPTGLSVQAFLESIEDDQKRADSLALVQLMQEITGQPPKMWGDKIIGFDQYHYKYESGREGDMCLIGFSPRKDALTLYSMGGIEDAETHWSRLGKYKIGGSCLYLKNLKNVDMAALKDLIQHAVERMNKLHPR